MGALLDTLLVGMEQVRDTQFSCFTSANRHSFCLIYKYKSTNTDTEATEQMFSKDVVRDMLALLVCSPAGLTQVDLLKLLGYFYAMLLTKPLCY